MGDLKDRQKEKKAQAKECKGTKGPELVSTTTRAFISLGLLMGLFLMSLDQTVVGTSLPKIIENLGGLDRYTWVISAYMLAMSIMIPVAGKMSDCYGRKPLFLFGMLFFLGGSFASGAAQDMNQLILFRFLQGFGAGAIMPVALATVTDLYPPSEWGKIQGIFLAVIMVSLVIGPFLGGWIVDHVHVWNIASWRWVFYVNLPIGIIAILVTLFKFPHTRTTATKPIDYPGIVALTIALSAGLLITFWGGTNYGWTSIEILGLAVVCIAFLFVFIYLEKKAADPILPLPLFKSNVFSIGCAANFLVSIGLLGLVAFLPLFLQVIVGMSATHSGEQLMPLMLAIMVTMVLSGVFLKKTGYKVWLVAGSLMASIGLYLLSTIHSSSSPTVTLLYLGLIGMGLGLLMANLLVAALNTVDHKDAGVASSTMNLFRTIGSTIGVTVLGTIINRRIGEELPKNLPPGTLGTLPGTDVNTLGNILMGTNPSGLPPDVIEGIRTSVGNSITYAFFISSIFVLIAFILLLFIKDEPLEGSMVDIDISLKSRKAKKKEKDQKVPAKEDEEAEAPKEKTRSKTD